MGTGWVVHFDAYLHEVHSSGASLHGCLSVARVSAPWILCRMAPMASWRCAGEGGARHASSVQAALEFC